MAKQLPRPRLAGVFEDFYKREGWKTGCIKNSDVINKLKSLKWSFFKFWFTQKILCDYVCLKHGHEKTFELPEIGARPIWPVLLDFFCAFKLGGYWHTEFRYKLVMTDSPSNRLGAPIWKGPPPAKIIIPAPISFDSRVLLELISARAQVHNSTSSSSSFKEQLQKKKRKPVRH